MSQTLITQALAANRALAEQMSLDAWAADEQSRGEKVELFRNYMAGDHRSDMTTQMKDLLRVADTGTMNEFNVNHMPRVVWSMTNRLEVTALNPTLGGATTEPATKWSEELQYNNRFDALQLNVHEASIRDGETYLFIDWDNDAQRVRWVHEPAYDGTSGLIVLYPDNYSTTPIAAIKVWHITTESGNVANTMRVNVYYPDRIERYIAPDGGNMRQYGEEGADWPLPWKDKQGKPLGVPVAVFPNRATSHTQRGHSEIENAIPPQDALNRLLYSMVMTAEFTAFRVGFAFGFEVGEDITPGMIVEVTREGQPLNKDDQVSVDYWPEGDLSSFIAVSEHLKREISVITDTPMLELSKSNISGETLKQLEVGLLGKCNRFKVRAGNAWEDTMEISRRVQAAFGPPPPEFDRVNTEWKDSEIRNDAEVIKNVKEIREDLDLETRLELYAPVMGFDGAQIKTIVDRVQAGQNQQMAALFSQVPEFADATGGNGFDPLAAEVPAEGETEGI